MQPARPSDATADALLSQPPPASASVAASSVLVAPDGAAAACLLAGAPSTGDNSGAAAAMGALLYQSPASEALLDAEELADYTHMEGAWEVRCVRFVAVCAR